MRLLDDFTYEHASRRSPAENALKGHASGARCATYGGRSQGTSDTPERTLAFLDELCPETEPCVQNYTHAPTGRPLLSVTAGTVLVEQTECGRAPAYYLCDREVRQTLWAHPHHFRSHHKCGSATGGAHGGATPSHRQLSPQKTSLGW